MGGNPAVCFLFVQAFICAFSLNFSTVESIFRFVELFLSFLNPVIFQEDLRYTHILKMHQDEVRGNCKHKISVCYMGSSFFFLESKVDSCSLYNTAFLYTSLPDPSMPVHSLQTGDLLKMGGR